MGGERWGGRKRVNNNMGGDGGRVVGREKEGKYGREWGESGGEGERDLV